MTGGSGKPPESGQFKKRQLGNAKGRSRRPETPMSRAYLFRKVAKETVRVETSSGERVMSRWEAVVRMLQNQALNGNSRAAQLLHGMRKEFPGNALAGGTYIWLVTEADLGL